MNRLREARGILHSINVTTDYVSNTVSQSTIINMETARKLEAAK
jgi:hypothetical protein